VASLLFAVASTLAIASGGVFFLSFSPAIENSGASFLQCPLTDQIIKLTTMGHKIRQGDDHVL
jgi:hypothetical protein